MRVVVLGIGNTILSDEGAGVKAADALAASHELPENVEVIDGGTSGMELLGPLSGTDLLIVLDAVVGKGPPGTVVKLAGGEVPVFFRAKLSPHQVSICDVLAGLEFSGDPPGELVLIGVVPQNMELGMELTDTVAAQLPRMVALTVEVLRSKGLDVRPKALALEGV